MGILDTLKSWADVVIPVVIKTARSVGRFLTSASEAADALMKGDRLAFEVTSSSREVVSHKGPGDGHAQSREDNAGRQLAKVEMSVSELRRALATQAHAHKLALMITELRVSGEILRGISANIELHSSNLQIHLHTIKNTTGLVADVNRQRTAIKTMVGKINHIMNVLKLNDGKISGLDVDMRMGDISVKSAYRAYESAQKHLKDEILRFGGAIDAQWRRIDAVAEMSKGVPQRSKILHWLNAEVKPSLTKANDAAADIYEKVQLIAPLEQQVIAEMASFD